MIDGRFQWRIRLVLLVECAFLVVMSLLGHYCSILAPFIRLSILSIHGNANAISLSCGVQTEAFLAAILCKIDRLHLTSSRSIV